MIFLAFLAKPIDYPYTRRVSLNSGSPENIPCQNSIADIDTKTKIAKHGQYG